jgi:hypothetical protein
MPLSELMNTIYDEKIIIVLVAVFPAPVAPKAQVMNQLRKRKG